MIKQILLCLLVLAIILLHIKLIVKENFNNNITFLTKTDAINFLVNNEDQYYQTFNEMDMHVRNIQNIKDYEDYIRESVIEFPEDTKIRLTNLILILKNLFQHTNMNYFKGERANDIEWKIICVKGKLYESGLPHTRMNIIILPIEYIENSNDTKILKVLFHELIHVYQRLFPDDVEQFLITNNYVKYISKSSIPNTRANPDVDEWIYSKDDIIYTAKYIENAQSISDVVYSGGNSSFEHPFEHFAYELSEIIENKN